MPPPEPPSSITLKVKVPPGYLTPTTTSELFTLGSIPVSSTVGALRQQIQQSIPSNPAPERQRILYGGRALVDNEQTLADALNTRRDPEQLEYVVHLLIKAEGNAASGRSTPSGVQQARFGGIGAPPAQAVPQQHQHQPMPPQPHQGPPNTVNAGPDPMQQHFQQHLRAHGALHQHQHQPQHNRHGGQGFHIEGVGPDGQRFQIHQQTTHFPGPPMQMPGAALPGQLPIGLPMVPGPNGPVPLQLPAGFGPPPGFLAGGMQPPPTNWPQFAARPTADSRSSTGQGVTSALDRARENVAEMRRMLDEIANLNNSSDEERRRRVEEVQRRVTSVNNYIDPFNLATPSANRTGASHGEGRRSAPPGPTDQQGAMQNGLPQPTSRLPHLPPPLQNPPRPGFANVQVPGMPPQQVQLPSDPNDVSVYLLSSPQGPQALLFSPQHGTHIGSYPATAPPGTAGWQQQRFYPLHRPVSSNTAPQAPQAPPAAAAAAAAEPPDPVAQAAARLVEVQAQAAANAADGRDANGNLQDPLGMQPILNHFWMLVRILIFSYFLLGSNLGWQRPVIMLGIGLGFWVVRAGLLGDEGRVRRWWDGVVGVGGQGRQQPQADAGQRNGDPTAAPAQAQAQGQGLGDDANLNMRRNNAMPTPAQVAQRILNEQEARRHQQGAERRHWLREQLRPVERAVALFVASLWPGIGEAHVREQRRLREEREQQEEEERRRNILREEARRQAREAQQAAEKSSGETLQSAGEGAGNMNAAGVEEKSHDGGSAGE